jgi:hypothetical protein
MNQSSSAVITLRIYTGSVFISGAIMGHTTAAASGLVAGQATQHAHATQHPVPFWLVCWEPDHHQEAAQSKQAGRSAQVGAAQAGATTHFVECPVVASTPRRSAPRATQCKL